MIKHWKLHILDRSTWCHKKLNDGVPNAQKLIPRLILTVTSKYGSSNTWCNSISITWCIATHSATILQNVFGATLPLRFFASVGFRQLEIYLVKRGILIATLWCRFLAIVSSTFSSSMASCPSSTAWPNWKIQGVLFFSPPQQRSSIYQPRLLRCLLSWCTMWKPIQAQIVLG